MNRQTDPMRSAQGDIFFWLLRLLERAWERAWEWVWRGRRRG